LDGVAPAIGNAILDACGVDIDSLPITPDKVYFKLQELNKD
jgi:putative selenate reductase molybdopterin-binding subunit